MGALGRCLFAVRLLNSDRGVGIRGKTPLVQLALALVVVTASGAGAMSLSSRRLMRHRPCVPAAQGRARRRHRHRDQREGAPTGRQARLPRRPQPARLLLLSGEAQGHTALPAGLVAASLSSAPSCPIKPSSPDHLPSLPPRPIVGLAAQMSYFTICGVLPRYHTSRLTTPIGHLRGCTRKSTLAVNRPSTLDPIHSEDSRAGMRSKTAMHGRRMGATAIRRKPDDRFHR
jgi:hypothetical protein